MFVCLFAVNAKTTARIDAKRSGITKNNPESVLCGLKSPVLAFLGRYHDISGFSFTADRHFYLSPFHFQLLPRRLTQSTFAKTASTALHITTELQADMHRQVHVHTCRHALCASIIICMHAYALHVITLKHCHNVAMGMTLLQLPNSLSST